MPWAPKTHQPVATTFKQHRPKGYKDRPSTAGGWLYGRRWRKVAGRNSVFRHRHPFCAECQRNGRTRFATVTDHIIPHRGDPQLFWDYSNWQSLCESCHNAKTATEHVR